MRSTLDRLPRIPMGATGKFELVLTKFSASEVKTLRVGLSHPPDAIRAHAGISERGSHREESTGWIAVTN